MCTQLINNSGLEGRSCNWPLVYSTKLAFVLHSYFHGVLYLGLFRVTLVRQKKSSVKVIGIELNELDLRVVCVRVCV